MNKYIYNIAPDSYKNTHLMKDCCLVPYALSKQYGYTPVIVTPQMGEYPYLDYFPEILMEFQATPKDMMDWIYICIKYIEINYAKIDILFCFGPYPVYGYILPLYKKFNPNGKVILKLDANIEWIDRIPYENNIYINILSNCDVITCESKKVKEYASAKWPFVIDYVPNGYLDVLPVNRLDYDEKENIIITVASIGRREKRHDILLEAFAKIAHLIPEWKLKLIGGIDDIFKPYVEKFFSTYPELVGRVIFTGEISDKNQLNMEYSKSKIFVLTSDFEGFPNVFSEAARYGLYMISSEIDAVDDMTGLGKYGRSFPLGDIDSLANILCDVCKTEFDCILRDNYEEIIKYVNRYFNYKFIAKKLQYLLEGDI